jgi:hypothetical protein
VLPEVDQLATVVVCEDEQATLDLLRDHLTADRYAELPAPCASDVLRLSLHAEAARGGGAGVRRGPLGGHQGRN